MAVITDIPQQKVDELAARLPEVEKSMNFTLADLIREGSMVTGQKIGGWVDAENACALSAVAIAAKAHHLI